MTPGKRARYRRSAEPAPEAFSSAEVRRYIDAADKKRLAELVMAKLKGAKQ